MRHHLEILADAGAVAHIGAGFVAEQARRAVDSGGGCRRDPSRVRRLCVSLPVPALLRRHHPPGRQQGRRGAVPFPAVRHQP
jgi:hypothetical protein